MVGVTGRESCTSVVVHLTRPPTVDDAEVGGGGREILSKTKHMAWESCTTACVQICRQTALMRALLPSTRTGN